MPFPSEPLTLRGGCNCTAVRWRMLLPEASRRVANPYHTPEASMGDLRLPTAVICHYDGCRRATGSLGAYGFTSDMALLELSILPRTTVPNQHESQDDEIQLEFEENLYPVPQRDTILSNGPRMVWFDFCRDNRLKWVPLLSGVQSVFL